MYSRYQANPRSISLSSHVRAIVTDDSVQVFGLAVLAGLVLGLAVISHM